MKIQKVYLIAAPIAGYYDAVKYAFEANGVECDYFVYKTPNKILTLVAQMLNINYTRLLWRERIKVRKYLLKSHSQYDCVIVFGAYFLTDNDLKFIKIFLKLPVMFWFLDSINNFTASKTVLQCADIFLCYNKEDATYLSSIGKSAFFVPLAFDSRFYQRLLNVESAYDLYFIGSLKSRVQFLNEYIEKLKNKNLRIRIDGHLSWLYRIRNRNKFRTFFTYYTGKLISHKEINLIYNSTRICLNIQPVQATSGFAIRTYEILGSGGLQLTNGNKELLDQVFKGANTIIHYNNLDQLVEVTNWLIDEQKEETQYISGNDAIEQHSFIYRVGEILEYLSKLREFA